MLEAEYTSATTIINKLTAYRAIDTAIADMTDVNLILRTILSSNAGEALGLSAAQMKTAVDTAITGQETLLAAV